jgi:hypothetical protein
MGIIASKGNSANVTFTAPQEIVISHLDDSIQSYTKDGTGTGITSTTVGSDVGLDVNVLNFPGGSPTPRSYKSTYNEVLAVASGSNTTVATYTVPLGSTAFLQRIEVGGTNVAVFTALLNGSPINKKRSYFGASLDVTMEFQADETQAPGLTLSAGDIITIKALHNRPSSGDFSARIQVIEE